MAEENEELSLEEEGNSKGGNKKKLIIIIAAVVLLLVAAAGSYFLFFSGEDQVAAEQTKEEQVSEETETDNFITIYVAMPRPFVFNVQDGKRDRLVQIKVQLMVRGNSNSELAKKHIPLLEGTLVRVFSAATIEQLRSPAGKAQLRIYSLEALNEATAKVENKALIHSVLFTGFVLQ